MNLYSKPYQTLVHIARSGSFQKTAQALNMTLSSVSMQMKSLEERLGVMLFDRKARPPRLTPMGRKIVDYANLVIDAETQLMSASSSPTELAGTFRLGFVATASVRLLPQVLKRARQKTPLAHFEIATALSEILEAQVLSGDLDAAIVTATDEPPAGLEYHLVRQEALAYAIPPEFSHQSLKEVAKRLSFLQFNPGSGIGKLIERETASLLKLSRDKMIMLDSVEAIMECVNAGIGFTLLTEPDIQRYAAQNVDIAKPKTPLSRDLVLVKKRNSAIDRKSVV